MLSKFLDLVFGDLSPATRLVVWRVVISSVLFGYIAYSSGMIPNVSGYAHAAEVAQLSTRLSGVERSVICNAVTAEISRLRGEKRTAETQMFEAQQMQNLPLIQHLTITITSINADIDDQIQKRATNNCN